MRLLAFVLLLAPLAAAQETMQLPDAPSQTIANNNVVQAMMTNPRSERSNAFAVKKPQPKKAIKSPSYILLLTAATAATIADCESTRAALNDPNNRESNPLFGTHPSRARMYGISVPILAVNAWAGATLKQRGKRWWPLGLTVVTGAHGAAALHNAFH